MQDLVGFIIAPLSCITVSSSNPVKRPSESSKFHLIPRRSFLTGALSTILLANTPTPSFSREWNQDELCTECTGMGVVNCDFCVGSGVFELGDAVTECPNCQGDGIVRCAACIGMGLAETNGILRDASRDGRIRMRRDGRYEILQCEAFPACSIYGRGKTPSE